eukprot:Skav205572  [mRNA]  locus=scaffold1407:233305:234877:+ [translate_table: standard]
MADRNFSVRCNKAASRPDVWLQAKNQNLFCKLEIDGMDQSKFAVPRMKQMAGTSSYSKCWRPAVHVTGALLFGQIEYFAVMKPDLAKDSNMNATVTCRVLDLMQEKLDALGAGHSFPGELVIMCDNTPSANRTLVIEELKSTMDFKKYLSPVNLHLTGLTSTHLLPNANHMWRFCHRLSVDEVHYGAIECHHRDWTGMQENPADVVLIVKQFLSSPAHSQAPQIVLPLEVAERLTGQLEPAQRNKFSETTLTEFRKSATTFGAQPWNLLKAQYFLEELCDLNEKEDLPPGVDLKFYFSAEVCQALSMQSHAAAAADRHLPEDGPGHDDGQEAKPRHVIAGRRAAKAKPKAKPKVKAAVKMAPVRKRPAAASESRTDNAPVLKRPSTAASTPADSLDPAVAQELPPEGEFEFGCSKCRKRRLGCTECQAKADANHGGFKRLSNGMVIRDFRSA